MIMYVGQEKYPALPVLGVTRAIVEAVQQAWRLFVMTEATFCRRAKTLQK